MGTVNWQNVWCSKRTSSIMLEYKYSIWHIRYEEPRQLRGLSADNDLAVSSSSPDRGEIFSTVNRVPLHTAFHYNRPIVLISLK